MNDKAFDISGKVTIVTGGGTGIGADIAREFCRRGAKVLITSRTMDHLGPIAEGIRKEGGTVEAMICDVRQNDQVEAVVNKAVDLWGRVDTLVNNAGASFVAHAQDISANGFNAIVSINLTGTFLFSKAVAKVMMEKKTGGCIVNVSSDSGVYGAATMSHYGAAKAGVVNLTRSLAIEWAKYGIRVNCISPGPIETPGVMEVLWPTKELQTKVANSTALKRFGTGQEVAWPCIFLASAASSYITGANLLVDGFSLSNGDPYSRLSE
jgi:3-oxoacyl-[acyl-carrier protein] reductase